MAKQKKKRSKVYRGRDAALDRPAVTHVSAVSRSPLRQWIFDHKTLLRVGSIVLSILIVLILVIIGIVQIVSGR